MQLSFRLCRSENARRLPALVFFGVVRSTWLAPVLAEFSLRHPKIVVELLTDSRLLNLSRREADVVVRIAPFTEPDVISRKLLHTTTGFISAAAPSTRGQGMARVPVWSRWTRPLAACPTWRG